MYTRSDDDILPGRHRRPGRRARHQPRLGPVAAPGRPARREAPAATAGRPPVPPAARSLAPPAGRVRPGRVLVEVLLTVAALVGVAAMGVTVVAARSGVRPLVVRSGSMEPAIPTGSMVLVQRVDAADVEVGDVVAVDGPDGGRVTHRVVSLGRRGDAAELTLKGDANEDVDPAPVTVRRAERVTVSVPSVGRAAAFVATPGGGFALGCALTGLAMVVLWARPSRRARAGHG